MVVELVVCVSGLAFRLENLLVLLGHLVSRARDLGSDLLAGEVLGGLDRVIICANQNDVGRLRVGHREIQLLCALLGDRHSRKDCVEFLGQQRRDDAVPLGIDELDLDAKLLAKLVQDIDVVADDLPVLEELVGHILRFQADDKLTALLDVVEHIRHRHRTRGQYRKCEDTGPRQCSLKHVTLLSVGALAARRAASFAGGIRSFRHGCARGP